ncbi:MAG: phosphate ABC transporter permease PstA [Thermodesulfobacteriota bacterium]
MNRYASNIFFLSLSWAAAGICALILFFLFAVITWNGIKAIDIEFLFTVSRNFGAEGGIFYQIIGSLLLIVSAAVLSLPLALGTAIFKSEYLKSGLLKKIGTALIYGLNGVPSVIFGIFGLILFVNILNTGISWFVGSIILAMMILPTIIMASYQSINSIPKVYRESALALGLSKWEVITRVLLPQGVSGAVTGLLVGLARAVGETAPIMFIATAFSGVNIPGSLFQPVTALPTHILALAQQATNQQALRNAWGTSFVLLGMVMIFSLSALVFRTKLRSVSQR